MPVNTTRGVPKDGYSNYFGILESELGNAIGEYKRIKDATENGDGVLGKAKLRLAESRVRDLYLELQEIRQANCHHEFVVGRDECCGCGVGRTPETEALAEARRPHDKREEKRRGRWERERRNRL